MKKFLLLLLQAAVLTTLAQPPIITSFSPTSGPVGITVTIKGNNFSPNPTENIVYFGAVKAPVISASLTMLTVTATAGATYQPVTVTTGGLTAYANHPFVLTIPACIQTKSTQEFLKQKEYDLGIPFGINGAKESDFNNDGKTDLLIFSNAGRVFVYQNGSTQDELSFPDSILLVPFNQPQQVVVADLDGDGKTDLTVANVFPSVAIFRNTSTAEKIQFAPLQVIPQQRLTVGVDVTDVNLDGKPDLISTSFYPGGNISISLNTSTPGQISFAAPVLVSVNKRLFEITTGDLDGDGKPDLVTNAYVDDQNPIDATPYVFRNLSQGTDIRFEGPIAIGGNNIENLELADMDGDSKLDVVTSTFKGGISIYLNKSTVGAIQFGEQTTVAKGTRNSWSFIPLANLAGDSKPDLFEETFPGLILVNLSTPGNIHFEARTSTPGWEDGVLAFADLDGDGLNDMVTTSQVPNSLGNTTFSLLRNNTVCPPDDAPAFLNNLQIVRPLSCAGNDGLISIIPTAGVAPFQYSIDGGINYVAGPDDGYSFSGLTQGTYHLRLKDSRGLESETISKEIEPAPTFHLDHFTTTNASCGGSNGTIDIVTKCGDGPYHLRINGGNNEIISQSGNFHLAQLPAGSYKISITDAFGTPILGSSPLEVGSFDVYLGAENCPASCSTPPAFLNNLQIILDASCNKNDGQISLIPTASDAPFFYSINGGANYVSGPSSGFTFRNLAPGLYRLRIKDANGCESETATRFVKPDYYGPCAIVTATKQGSRAAEAKEVAAVRVYPNPSRGRFKVLLTRSSSPKVELQVVDAKGSVLQNRIINSQETGVVDIDLSGKAKGLYLIRVLSDNGTQQTKVLLQ